MHHKLLVRPKYGLSMKILRLMLGDKQLEEFVDAYMKTKRAMILNQLLDKVAYNTRKEGKQFLKIKPIVKIELT